MRKRTTVANYLSAPKKAPTTKARPLKKAQGQGKRRAV